MLSREAERHCCSGLTFSRTIYTSQAGAPPPPFRFRTPADAMQTIIFTAATLADLTLEDLRALDRRDLQAAAKAAGVRANAKSSALVAALAPHCCRGNSTAPDTVLQPLAPPPPPPQAPPPPPPWRPLAPSADKEGGTRRSRRSSSLGGSGPSHTALHAFDPDEGTPPDVHVRPVSRQLQRGSLCLSSAKRRRSSVTFAPSTDSPPPSRERLHKQARALSDASLEED